MDRMLNIRIILELNVYSMTSSNSWKAMTGLKLPDITFIILYSGITLDIVQNRHTLLELTCLFTDMLNTGDRLMNEINPLFPSLIFDTYVLKVEQLSLSILLKIVLIYLLIHNCILISRSHIIRLRWRHN